jgi:hypothetical protein
MLLWSDDPDKEPGRCMDEPHKNSRVSSLSHIDSRDPQFQDTHQRGILGNGQAD